MGFMWLKAKFEVCVRSNGQGDKLLLQITISEIRKKSYHKNIFVYESFSTDVKSQV